MFKQLIRVIPRKNFKSNVKYFSLAKFNKNKELEQPNYIDSHKLTNAELVDSNYGLKQFIKKTYICAGGAITSSLGISLIGSSIDPNTLSDIIMPLFGTGFVLGIGGAIGLGFTKYSVHTDIINNQPKTENIQPRITSHKNIDNNYENRIKASKQTFNQCDPKKQNIIFN